MIKKMVAVLLLSFLSFVGLRLFSPTVSSITLAVCTLLELWIFLNYRKSLCYKNSFGGNRREIGWLAICVMAFWYLLVTVSHISSDKYEGAIFFIGVLLFIQGMFTLGITLSVLVGIHEQVYKKDVAAQDEARTTKNREAGREVEVDVDMEYDSDDGIIYLVLLHNSIGHVPLPKKTYFELFPSEKVSAIIKTTKDYESWHTDVLREAGKACPITSNDKVYARFANTTSDRRFGRLVITGKPDYVNKVLFSLNLSPLT